MSDGGAPTSPRPDDRALAGLSRSDLVLAAVPVAFVVGPIVAAFADRPFRIGRSGAAGVCALALIDGRFRNPPERPRAGGGPS